MRSFINGIYLDFCLWALFYIIASDVLRFGVKSLTTGGLLDVRLFTESLSSYNYEPFRWLIDLVSKVAMLFNFSVLR